MTLSITADAFFSSVVTGDMEALQKLPEDFNVNVIDSSTGKTALDYAVENQHISVIKFLLNHNANPNFQDEWQEIPLMLALDNLKIVHMLIGKTNVNMKDAQGMTPLMLALRKLNPLFSKDSEDNKKYTAVAQALLDANADVNISNIYGQTALMDAVQYADINLAEKIILKGADINAKNNAGETALTLAVKQNRYNVVNLLIRNGADVNVVNQNGQTALMEAAQNGQTQMAKLLIKKGADFSLVNKSNETAFTVAAKNNHHKTQIQMNQEAQAKLVRRQRIARGEVAYQRRGREYF